MSGFQFREIRVENYRCFTTLALLLEADTTVLFAENGGGKTALLTALAMGLSAFLHGTPKPLQLDRHRDPLMRTLDETRREPVGTCEITWTAKVGEEGNEEVATWSATADPRARRVSNKRKPILDALERIRAPGERWPLCAWYGVEPPRTSASRPQGCAHRRPMGSLRVLAQPEPR